MVDSTWQRFRSTSGKYGLASAILAAALFAYVRSEFVYDRGKEASFLLLLVFIALFLSLILGLLGLPKLESFVALFIFTVTALLFVAAAPNYLLP